MTGFFILITLISNTTVDLLSGSAERMLWNDAYYHIVLGIIVICTIFIKPLMLYFAADIAALQGHDRDKSRELYRDSRIYPALQYLTLFFGLQFILKSFLKIYFISVLV